MPFTFDVPVEGEAGLPTEPNWATKLIAIIDEIATDAATTAEVNAAISAAIAALVASSPSTLDTLNELATALGDDPNFATTMTTALAGKQPLDADLTAIAALATATFGRSLLTMADAAATKTALAIAQADITDNGQVTYTTQTNDYTLVAGDKGTVVEMNKASAVNLTVPPNSSVPFALGTIIEIHQYGAGQVTVVAGGGVTIRSPLGLKLSAQYATASLRKRGTDEWVLSGDTTI